MHRYLPQTLSEPWHAECISGIPGTAELTSRPGFDTRYKSNRTREDRPTLARAGLRLWGATCVRARGVNETHRHRGARLFPKVVDCQWACPAHTPVPEYIRLIAAGRYSDAYMVNWKSNVFPGDSRAHLRPAVRARLPARPRREGAGRDLPPQARRRRLQGRHPRPPAAAAEAQERQAHRAGRRAARPRSTVARDLAPLGYQLRRVRPGPQGRRHDPHARFRASACRNRSSTRSAATSSTSASSSSAASASTA